MIMLYGELVCPLLPCIDVKFHIQTPPLLCHFAAMHGAGRYTGALKTAATNSWTALHLHTLPILLLFVPRNQKFDTKPKHATVFYALLRSSGDHITQHNTAKGLSFFRTSPRTEHVKDMLEGSCYRFIDRRNAEQTTGALESNTSSH